MVTTQAVLLPLQVGKPLLELLTLRTRDLRLLRDFAVELIDPRPESTPVGRLRAARGLRLLLQARHPVVVITNHLAELVNPGAHGLEPTSRRVLSRPPVEEHFAFDRAQSALRIGRRITRSPAALRARCGAPPPPLLLCWRRSTVKHPLQGSG